MESTFIGHLPRKRKSTANLWRLNDGDSHQRLKRLPNEVGVFAASLSANAFGLGSNREGLQPQKKPVRDVIASSLYPKTARGGQAILGIVVV